MLSERFWSNILRLGLLLSACGWGISFFFTFAPWQMAADQLWEMGSAERMPYDPQLDYWLRMASSAFGCIGIASALACVSPAKFPGMIRLLGPFHLIVGTTLAVSAHLNHLDPVHHLTYRADITFCFATAFLILAPLVREARRKP
ncbi:hypothetical protein JIN84_09235 [Luteolibacter yonseiensis]|uniref:Uncharacterized protein n=1 Tax=Luteolibacter yonseiensis TaxID=1144680 RepID=A0A934R5V0_9BACT|nr:hypothetical protein [Luteolibacter yonseiensis]MBK1815800.1 hypothetical protein [Luteolibacter yonseiensis]